MEKIYQQEYEIGKPLYNLKVVGKCDAGDTGTEVTDDIDIEPVVKKT